MSRSMTFSHQHLFRIRFPCVSSTHPPTPPKPPSRPRTAPNPRSRAESSVKSAGSSRTLLPLINENSDKDSTTIESNVIQPTQIDVQRDVQILILDDNDHSTQRIGHEITEQIPF